MRRFGFFKFETWSSHGYDFILKMQTSLYQNVFLCYVFSQFSERLGCRSGWMEWHCLLSQILSSPRQNAPSDIFRYLGPIKCSNARTPHFIVQNMRPLLNGNMGIIITKIWFHNWILATQTVKICIRMFNKSFNTNGLLFQ